MTSLPHISRAAGRAAPAKGGVGAFRWLTLALEARRQRLALKALTDERLRDLGLTRSQALHEADKPMWNVPAHWLR